MVFLRIQPYRQRSLAKKRYEKLSPRFFGPYNVIRQIGQVAYELALPKGCKVHPIFHVSLLRKAEGPRTAVFPPPLPLTEDWELQLQPASVLAHRWIQVSEKAVLELLIHWQDRPSTEDSWEEYDLIMEQFPQFRLEDKAAFQGEGIICY